jgi:hypothetical protein
MPRTEIRLYKIAYNAETRAAIRPPYRLLDNSDGKPDWYELWPILRFLEDTELEDGVWYGFVSPKFPEKADLSDSRVFRIVERHADRDVCLFSYDWASLAYWQNPWVSGDRWHPGLMKCTEEFLNSRGISADLSKVWTDFDTSVLSNYMVARKRFWLEWRDVARAYFNYVESGGPALLDNQPARHRGEEGYRLRTFVQERLVCWVLASGDYRVGRPNYVLEGSLRNFLGENTNSWRLRVLLFGCHLSKKLARRTGWRSFERLFATLHAMTRRARNGLKAERARLAALPGNGPASG